MLNPNGVQHIFLMQVEEMATPLDVAMGKLQHGWTMDTLPIKDTTNPMWLRIENDCRLTGPEVVLLQNEVARRQEGIHYFLFTLNKLFYFIVSSVSRMCHCAGSCVDFIA